MKRWITLSLIGTAIFTLFASTHSIRAQSQGLGGQILTEFVSGTGVSLEQLSAGNTGQGWLLYYSPDRSPNQPGLVVRLSHQENSDLALAEVFESPLSFDYVPIERKGNEIRLIANATPQIILKAHGGWWFKAGHANYNLDVQVNGPIYAMWGAGYDPALRSNGWLPWVKREEPAVSVTVRDTDQDGWPDWDLRLLLPAFPGRGYYRTNYAERKCDTPAQIDPGVSPLWPFISQAGEYEQSSGELRPPIVVDWKTGKITHFSEIVSVRNQNCSYSLYSLDPIQPGKVNPADFETPFAFYDLSGEGQGYPNLILRTERYPDRDPWIPGLIQGFETVRYSWRNAVGDQGWDYKVEVLGFHPYTDRTPIAGGQYTIDAPSYENFPRWVIEREWPLVTFIDTGKTYYPSIEGIYEWSPRAVGDAYFRGGQDSPDARAFTEIMDGFRGEYRTQKELAPILYLSPVDNQLHLLGAEHGLWNLGDGSWLREWNLDGGPYINGWTLERSLPGSGEASVAASSTISATQTLEALHVLGGHLLYSGPEGVILGQSDDPAALFEILPPSDPVSWRSFQAQVLPYTSQRRDPNSLKSWLEGSLDAQQSVSAARISDVRAVEGGFRFVLHLQPGYTVAGLDLLALSGLQPGDYVVEYNGQFLIEPLSPAQVSITFRPFPGQPKLDEPLLLQIKAQNRGGADANDLTLIVEAFAGEQRIELSKQPASILAGGSLDFRVSWQPLEEQDWIIAARLLDAEGKILASIEQPLIVNEDSLAKTIDTFTVLQGQGFAPSALAALLVFGALIAMGLRWSGPGTHEEKS